MKFNEIDVVRAMIPFPNEGIEEGEEGTVVVAFTVPCEAYEVEFINVDGTTKAMFTILPEHLELVWKNTYPIEIR